MSILGWKYWDVLALVAGVVAVTATIVAWRFDLWGEALPIQFGASVITLVAAILGWRAGIRSVIAAGLAGIALSWAPIGLILYSCIILKNCP